MFMARPRTPSHVVIAYDATKDHDLHQLRLTINGVRMGDDILCQGDTIVVLAVLHWVIHPMGYRAKPCPDFIGTSFRAVTEAVTKKVDMFVNMLLHSAAQCINQGVRIKVKVIAGFPIKQVILQEIRACNAAWVVLDRNLRRDLGFYLMQLPCKIALIEESLAVEVLRSHAMDYKDTLEKKLFISLSKHVPLCRSQVNGNRQSIISCRSPMCSVLSAGSLESSNVLKANSMQIRIPKIKRARGSDIKTHLPICQFFCCVARESGIGRD